jgi:hypothetical protein
LHEVRVAGHATSERRRVMLLIRRLCAKALKLVLKAFGF